jgi:hypothetical protein
LTNLTDLAEPKLKNISYYTKSELLKMAIERNIEIPDKSNKNVIYDLIKNKK